MDVLTVELANGLESDQRLLVQIKNVLLDSIRLRIMQHQKLTDAQIVQ